MNPTPRLGALALLALVVSTGARGAPATPAPTTTPATRSAPASEAKAASGLVVKADLHDEYVVGFPLLVTVTVSNDTAGPLTFPDLTARPHLVRFNLKKGTVRWERYTTPPTPEPTNTWTLPPRSQRQVTLEIPSSAGLDPGDWELGVSVQDPAAAVTLPTRSVRLATAHPVGGSAVWESTIQQTSGAVIPWAHGGTGGFDLYVMRQDPKSPSRTVGQFWLGRFPAAFDPVLTRARPDAATARYIYWASGTQSFTLVRFEGTALRGKPRVVSVPYPKSELLGRGVTDAKGGVIIPLWIPDPAGAGGTIRALCVDERGTVAYREVVHLDARPAVVTTAVDAGSNLLLALGHAEAVDLYRIDPTLPVEIGAKGVRVTPLSDGWTSGALAFDTLPDRGDRPGGLALLNILVKAGKPASYRADWVDLSGKTFSASNPLPWTAPGTIVAVLPNAYGPFSYLTRDGTSTWFGSQGGTPVKAEPPITGTLWPSADTVYARSIVDGTVLNDRALGPLPR